MKNSLCITTVVDEKYQWYMPLFIACLHYSYPEYHQKYFFQGKMDARVKSALDSFDFDFDVVHGVFDGWKVSKYAPISWRFLVPPEHYKDYDYVYITDIDMMIMREKVSLLDFHVCEMEETGLCYSNSRRNSKHWQGKHSLSGLHFVSQEWFEKTEVARQKYANLVQSGERGAKREFDGHMLWLMVKESALNTCKKYKLVKRHHGIHLGNFRLFKQRQGKLNSRMDPDKCEKWRNFRYTTDYKNIIKLTTSHEALREQLDVVNEFVELR